MCIGNKGIWLSVLVVLSAGCDQRVKKDVRGMEKALFAAGCFWGVEHEFSNVEGVADAEAGYSGGHTSDPNYQAVCSGNTGHAESVLVFFDPKLVTYESLVRKFFEIHNPTTLNRQGPDRGSQYRSAVFYYHENQRNVAEKVKKELDEKGTYSRPVVTEITRASEFYPAEEYHQDYLRKKGVQYCH